MANMILIDRLAEFSVDGGFAWDENEIIDLEDISYAIHEAQPEEPEPFGDRWTCIERKSKEWHIGRVIYFINHPNEITDIELIGNRIDDENFPLIYIMDGSHRFVAALWLQDQGKLDKIPCMYEGDMDLLDYLTGETDVYPDE